MTGYSSNLLEHPHAIQVLLHLRKHFPMPLLELEGEIKANRSAIRRRIDELAEAGMIKIGQVRGMRHRMIVSLTPLGMDVANRLAEIERMISYCEIVAYPPMINY